MKNYTGKTLDEALLLASKEENTEINDLLYEVLEEKKGLFSKKVVIGVYNIDDVIAFGENYIKSVLGGIGIAASIKTLYNEGLIKVLIETEQNSLIIGKNGQTLQALNELTKLAISFKFKKKLRILLNVGDYKDKKYFRVVGIARKAAKEVLNTHIEIKLDSMTPDERKKVHNALSTWKNIRTESVGDGKQRAIVIKYVASEDIK
ncbi:MAG TPA: R3H domain-containing nucleic acid-binding protein [Candidatus Onthovivens sp.]|nr:R3H domain-containing nucleic acid-binding protein [Candidatus Onthovivens sp.]